MIPITDTRGLFPSIPIRDRLEGPRRFDHSKRDTAPNHDLCGLRMSDEAFQQFARKRMKVLWGVGLR